MTSQTQKTLTMILVGVILLLGICSMLLGGNDRPQSADATHPAVTAPPDGGPGHPGGGMGPGQPGFRPGGGGPGIRENKKNLGGGMPGNPYEAWPLSFPKMCGAIILLEEGKGPEPVTPEQAKQLVPALYNLAKAWQQVHIAEAALQPLFDDAQAEYINVHKPIYEQTSFAQSMPEPAHRGDNKTLAAAILVLEKSLADTTKRPPSKVAQTMQKMTLFDATAGIWDMRDKPELCPRKDQAEKMLPIIRGGVKHSRIVHECEEEMADVLTEVQVKYLADNMGLVTDAKRRAFDNPDQGPYQDPLIWTVIQMMEKKSKG